MDTKDDANKGIRILSLDNGGPGVYSQLLILKEYMTRSARDSDVDECDLYPADYFELMGGVGFGGLAAFLLGNLRMNVDQAIDVLVSVAATVFPDQAPATPDKEDNLKKLKEAIGDLLQERDVSIDMKMNDKRRPSGKCNIVLYTATAVNPTHPTLFRTYPSRGISLNPTIVEALCATLAFPSLFSPVKIGPRLREQNFIGGALGANNPTRELLKEASNIFGKDRRVAQILSIGSGRPHLISLDSSATEEILNQLGRDLASDCEMVARELSTRWFNVDAYLRLNVERGMEDIKMDDWTGLGAIESHTVTYLEGSGMTEIIEGSLQHLRDRVGSVTLAQINHSSTIKVTAKMAPVVSPCFVLRIREWQHMLDQLVDSSPSGQKIFPITGMGGCGKTQMVSYFLQEKGEIYTQTVYVNASSETSIKADLQDWARSLGDGHEKVWEDALGILVREPTDRRWVLILDNADDPNLQLVPFFPKCKNGTILITSRNRDVGNLSNTHHLEMGQMDREEAFSTLIKAAQRHLPLPSDELKSVNTLMDELGCLAVALVQAGTYCRQMSSTVQGILQPYSFTSYLSIFYSQRAALMKRVGPSTLDGYQRGVYTTLDLSYGAIPSPSRDFLHLISNFHHSDIPLSMLAMAAEASFKDKEIYLPRPERHRDVISRLHVLICIDEMWNELQMHETIQTLRSFSLVSTTSIKDTIFLHLHPLVQAWARDMVLQEREVYHAMATQTLVSCCISDNIRLYRYLLPHITDMLHAVKDSSSSHVNDRMAFGRVLLEQGRYDDAEVLFSESLLTMQNLSTEETKEGLQVAGWLAAAVYYQGRLDDAEKLLLELLEKRRDLLGVGDRETLSTMSNLASTHRDQGRWKEAEKLGVELLEQRRAVFGKEDPDTINAASHLAGTYSRQGRWDEAQILQLEVLEQSRVILGAEHLDTIQAAAILSAIYSDQGRWSEAEKLSLEVLKQRRTTLGRVHPTTIAAIADLAMIYNKQGRWKEAEEMELEVLEQRRATLGKKHHKTIYAAANLASTYRDLCLWTEAEKLKREVLEQLRALYGMEHPDTLQAMEGLAAVYSDQGRWEEGEKLLLVVLEKQRASFGTVHPETMSAAASLVVIYNSQGRWNEAEKLGLEVLEQHQAALGVDHPNAIRVAFSLSTTYKNQGRLDEAEKLKTEVLERRRAVLGIKHPDTIRTAATFAFDYAKQTRWSDVVRVGVNALELHREVFGMNREDTIVLAGVLALAHRHLSQWSEAEKLELELLDLSRSTLGKDHKDTIRAASNLAGIYSRQGRWDKAGERQLDVLEARRVTLGTDHAITATSAADLSVIYGNQGRWKEAVRLQLEVLEQRRGTLGMQHMDTIQATSSLAFSYNQLEEWGEVETLNLEVLKQRQVVLGMEHRETLEAAGSLGLTYIRQGRLKEAVQLLAPTAETSIRVCGHQDPRTKVYLHLLTESYDKLGRTEEGKETSKLFLFEYDCLSIHNK